MSGILPRVPDADGGENDHDDDHGVEPFARGDRGPGGEYEQQQEWTPELVPQHGPAGQVAMVPHVVGSVQREPPGRLGGGQARGSRLR